MAHLRFLVVLMAGSGAAWAQPAIPETPAGEVLKAWLEAFNSGEEARLEAYYKKYEPAASAASVMGFRAMTGGFDLIEIRKSAPLDIEFRVKERSARGIVAFGKMSVESRDGAIRVVSAPLRAIPPGGGDPDYRIDGGIRSRVIDGVVAKLNDYYVFPEMAKKMEDAVRVRQKRGEYHSIVDGDRFAALLTEQLREVSRDKHLRVNFDPFPQAPPAAEPVPDTEREGRFRREMERQNCMFRKVEVLPGNIGYVKFDAFANPAICGATVVAAMGFLAHTSAIIFDLRENGGGDPKMIALISSYLFSKPTHLNDLWERRGDKTEQYWTLPYVPGKRLDATPAYVLTSARTFSGAEEFSYNLKNLKRATIIGETTGGGAHPVSGHRLGDRFSIGVPFARAINPISKTNWEGTGVEPDVKTPQVEALAVALKLAREKLAQSK